MKISNAVTVTVMVTTTALAAAASVGCSGESGGGTESAQRPASTGKPGDSSSVPKTPTSQDTNGTDPAEACVEKGAKANDKGVGAYCDAKTKCSDGAFCTADFGAPVGAQFCTVICSEDADCGAGAHCFQEARGKGCVPDACMSK